MVLLARRIARPLDPIPRPLAGAAFGLIGVGR
jgi:hypothetical protein